MDFQNRSYSVTDSYELEYSGVVVLHIIIREAGGLLYSSQGVSCFVKPFHYTSSLDKTASEGWSNCSFLPEGLEHLQNDTILPQSAYEPIWKCIVFWRTRLTSVDIWSFTPHLTPFRTPITIYELHYSHTVLGHMKRCQYLDLYNWSKSYLILRGDRWVGGRLERDRKG